MPVGRRRRPGRSTNSARNGTAARGIGLRLLAAGLGVGLGAGGAAGIGWYYSSMLLDPTPRPVFPERVLAADATTVTLAASRLAAQPGIWGLRWIDGLAAIGPVTAADRRRIVRPLLGGPIPAAGTAAALDTGPYDPDPAARGLAFDEVAVPTSLGPCPAWHVPAAGDTWVILVHGRGGTRREALRVLPTLHRAGHPALVITYRNDLEAPASPDGHDHLGDTEWLDVESAVRWARARGARRVVLFGWSMGGAIIGAFLDRSARGDRGGRAGLGRPAARLAGHAAPAGAQPVAAARADPARHHRHPAPDRDRLRPLRPGPPPARGAAADADRAQQLRHRRPGRAEPGAGRGRAGAGLADPLPGGARAPSTPDRGTPTRRPTRRRCWGS